MPKGVHMTEEVYTTIKCLLNYGRSTREIMEITKLNDSTISRIRTSGNFADYVEKDREKRQSNQTRKSQASQKQVDMADLIPEEQPEPTHESLNRDMLKAILQSMQVLAANQSIIASKLDALIQKWE